MSAKTVLGTAQDAKIITSMVERLAIHARSLSSLTQTGSAPLAITTTWPSARFATNARKSPLQMIF